MCHIFLRRMRLCICSNCFPALKIDTNDICADNLRTDVNQHLAVESSARQTAVLELHAVVDRCGGRVNPIQFWYVWT